MAFFFLQYKTNKVGFGDYFITNRVGFGDYFITNKVGFGDYFIRRKTPKTFPRILRLSFTMIGSIASFSGCRRT